MEGRGTTERRPWCGVLSKSLWRLVATLEFEVLFDDDVKKPVMEVQSEEEPRVLAS